MGAMDSPASCDPALQVMAILQFVLGGGILFVCMPLWLKLFLVHAQRVRKCVTKMTTAKTRMLITLNMALDKIT